MSQKRKAETPLEKKLKFNMAAIIANVMVLMLLGSCAKELTSVEDRGDIMWVLFTHASVGFPIVVCGCILLVSLFDLDKEEDI